MFYDNSEVDFPNWWDSAELEHYVEDGSEADPLSSNDEGSSSEEMKSAVRYPVKDLDEGDAGKVSEPSSTPIASASAYDREVVRGVWEYAETVPGNDPDLWRKDEFGNWIYRLDYGRRGSEFGWEVFDPGVGRHSQGIYAMRPMQWQSFVRQYEVMG